MPLTPSTKIRHIQILQHYSQPFLVGLVSVLEADTDGCAFWQVGDPVRAGVIWYLGLTPLPLFMDLMGRSLSLQLLQ